MSATDELRRLLDERGVEHHDGESMTYINDADFMPASDGTFDVTLYGRTPAQAIDATLGRGTCRDVRTEDATIAFECSECGCWVAYDEYWETGIYVQGDGQQVHIHPRYCPNCGAKVVE